MDSYTSHQNATFLKSFKTPNLTAYFSLLIKFRNLRYIFYSVTNFLPYSIDDTLTKMFIITHLLFSLISMNPYKTYSKNPLFSYLLIISSMIKSYLLIFNRQSKDNSSFRSSFHSFKLKINGQTNLTNSFSNF